MTGPDPIAVVPVVPRDYAGTVSRLLSSLGMTAGFLLMALDASLPQITIAFPTMKWLPIAIAAGCSVWVSWQKAAETKTVVVVPAAK